MESNRERAQTLSETFKNRSRSITVFLLIFLMILGMVLAGKSTEMIMGDQRVTTLQDGWELKGGGESMKALVLPATVENENLEPLILSRTIDQQLLEERTLLLRTSMQDIQIAIDGEVLYAEGLPSDGLYQNIEASLWHMVDLPSTSEGKLLTVTLTSRMREFSGILNPIHAGPRDALMRFLFFNMHGGMLIAVILVLLGLMTILFSFALTNFTDNRLLYLGLFSIIVGIWILSEARILQFFTGNRFILGGISYMMVALIPVTFLLYLKDAVLMAHKKAFRHLALLFLLNFFLNFGLQVAGIAPFFQTIKLTLVFMLLGTLLVGSYLLYEVWKYQNHQAKQFLSYMLLIFIIVSVETLQFFSRNFSATSRFSRFGIMVFFLLLAFNTFKYIQEFQKAENEATFYEKLAYLDFLTKGGNRMAFERDVAELTDPEKSREFRLVLLDMNHLKQINDEFGHQEGDRAIVRVFNALVDSFQKEGTCYRLGGDEFAVLLGSTGASVYEKRIEGFYHRLQQEQLHVPYPVEVASGSDVLLPADHRMFRDFYHHVDQLMYQDKRRRKEKKNAG